MPGVTDGGTPKARLLGAELRDLREQAGLTVRDLGKALDVAPATISRYERGERAPKTDHVARTLGTLGVTGDKYEELVEFAENASEPNLIAKSSAGIHRHLLELSEFDQSAIRIIHVAPLIVPGPMQTRAYAREVMSSLSPEERALRVELRMARRDALNEPRQFDAYINERVLTDGLGDADVMAEQLEHLSEIASRPNVAVRILPAENRRWTIAHNGAFVLYEFPKAPPIIHLEHYRGPAFLYDAKDVQAYVDAVGTASDAVLGLDDSAKLIAATARDIGGQQQ